MKRRVLGKGGPEVSAIGLGCWGMSGPYGESDSAESIATIKMALDMGIDLIDTADIYGNGHNEELVGKGIKGIRNKVFLATKFGYTGNEHGELRICGHPSYVTEACDASLKRLATDHIDLYYLHRLDRNVPVEETVGAMARLVSAGKVRYIGLSEVSAGTLERANREYKVTALQSEYSLFTREVEAEVIPACRQLGTGFVPFSPLSRGLLAENPDNPVRIMKGDFRSRLPRFQEDNLERNRVVGSVIAGIAQKYGATAAQVSLAWLLMQWEGIIPIPGMKSRKYLAENAGSIDLELEPGDLEILNGVHERIAGDRYGRDAMELIDRDPQD